MAELPASLDIALLYAPPWSGPTRFSKHHLASYLAEDGNRVLYVEAPLSLAGLQRGRRFVDELRNALRPPRRVSERLWVRRHFLPVPYHSTTWLTSRRLANRLGQRLLAPAIRRDLAGLGFADPVLIAGLPHAADLVTFLPRRGLAYHCADEYASVRGFPDTLPELEADLCRQADLVVTTSETLCEARRRFNPNTHWVPNGVEFEHFSRPVAPAPELAGLAHPIIGFVGGLSEWVDILLLRALAVARPDWTFVLVGPLGTDVSAIQMLPNVRLLGQRSYATLPSYLSAMDVALIPFKRDQVTYHADPIKAYEYLAAGLPVVATDLPALRRLDQVVRLAASPESFEDHIQAALAAGRAAGLRERQAEAAHHDWETRFKVFDQLLRHSLFNIETKRCES